MSVLRIYLSSFEKENSFMEIKAQENTFEIIYQLLLTSTFATNIKAAQLLHDINNDLTFLTLEVELIKNQPLLKKIDEISQKIKELQRLQQPLL